MAKEYETVIGLETHAELNTKTKIFCSCKNEFGGEENTNCCPVCLGLPGALPVMNREAVFSAVKMGYALGCSVNLKSRMDRKNYFYPDLPKAYQISQYDVPICENGCVDIILPDKSQKRIRIERIHLEEDAGKLIHDSESEATLIDCNRCGVPLIEIVSEPDLRSGEDMRAYLDTLKAILQYLDISDCKMQEGSIRCDVNVSVRERGDTSLSTRVEMKNVNSFSAAIRAAEYESKRQIKLLEEGKKVLRETRRWDDSQGKSFVMRTKEDAQDYRFFPEPDLLTVEIEKEDAERLRSEMPELPNKKCIRYTTEFGLSYFDADLISRNRERAELFDKAVKLGAFPKSAANWLNGDIARLLGERGCTLSDTRFDEIKLFDLIKAVESGDLSHTAGKTVAEEVMLSEESVYDAAKRLGLFKISDESFLEEIVSGIISENERAVSDYKAGKTNAAGFLLGQCMRASGGKGDPVVFRSIIKDKLT